MASYRYTNATLRAPINMLQIHSLNPLTDIQTDCIYVLQHLLKAYENTFLRSDKDGNICITLDNGCFLLCVHKEGDTENPLVFINEHNEIVFQVDVSVLNNLAIQISKRLQAYLSIDNTANDISGEECSQIIAEIEVLTDDLIHDNQNKNLVPKK